MVSLGIAGYLYQTQLTTTQRPKTLNKKKIYTYGKKNDKVIANEQPNLIKRVDSKRAELSKLPKHAKFILDLSSINHFNNN